MDPCASVRAAYICFLSKLIVLSEEVALTPDASTAPDSSIITIVAVALALQIWSVWYTLLQIRLAYALLKLEVLGDSWSSSAQGGEDESYKCELPRRVSISHDSFPSVIMGILHHNNFSTNSKYGQ
ncbi:hypothetical protein DPSP01_011813 [Paraphaeosphaeria sporulosa]